MTPKKVSCINEERSPNPCELVAESLVGLSLEHTTSRSRAFAGGDRLPCQTLCFTKQHDPECNRKHAVVRIALCSPSGSKPIEHS
jgi:hypothetical protein